MLKQRVITALIMFFVFVGMVFFAPERVWFAGIALLMAWAAAEWANLAKFSQWSKVLYVMVMPILLALPLNLISALPFWQPNKLVKKNFNFMIRRFSIFKPIQA